MKQYKELLQNILDNGIESEDRTGTGTISLFGTTMRFNLKEGFPLLTTKKVAFKPMVAELLWFLEGSTDNNRLNELGAKIWNKWATEEGELGPIYGHQLIKWRDIRKVESQDRFLYQPKDGWKVLDQCEESGLIVGREINQIKELINNLKLKPRSRRHVVSMWNPADLPDESISPQENVKMGRAALAFCHAMFQFYAKPISFENRKAIWDKEDVDISTLSSASTDEQWSQVFDISGIPKYELSCRIYQR